MSTVAPDRGAARPGGGHQAPARGPRGSFELRAWVFMRVSGVLLLFMAIYHLVWWNLVVGVEHLSAEVVLARWNQPFWRIYNIALASFALLHGLNGARYVIEDYVRSPGARRAAKGVVYAVVLLTLAWGVFALLTFDFTSALRR